MSYINQSNQGTIQDKSIGSLYSKLFDEIRVRKEQVPLEGRQFFAEETTNLEMIRIGEVNSSLSLPMKNEDTDAIPYVSPTEGQYKEFTNVIYRLGIRVTRSAISRQKTRLLMAMLNGLPNSAARKMEYMFASLFNSGFATLTTGDGAFIFSASHNDGDAEVGAYSNLGTAAAFTTDSYFLAWLNFQNRTDAKGFPNPQVPTQVVYPTALHEDVMKVRGSQKYPQNSLNAIMPELFGQFQPVPMHWLTSTTAWFVHGSDNPNSSDKGFTLVTEEAPNYVTVDWPNNPDIVFGKRLRMSLAVGALHARDWYGNAGS